jgi:hypothetical protein
MVVLCEQPQLTIMKLLEDKSLTMIILLFITIYYILFSICASVNLSSSYFFY